MNKQKSILSFFGIFLIAMLFVPPSMPHVIPEAYADDVDLQIPTATMDMAVYKIYDPEFPVTSTLTFHPKNNGAGNACPIVKITAVLTSPEGGDIVHQNYDQMCLYSYEATTYYQEYKLYDSHPRGTYTWTITIDPYDDFAETNEGNNVKTVSFQFGDESGGGGGGSTPADTTPPVVTVPSNYAIDVATSEFNVDDKTAVMTDVWEQNTNWPPSATDDTDGTISTMQCDTWPDVNDWNGYSADLGSVGANWIMGFWSVGTTTVTCTATDAAGNSASKDFTVTITKLATAVDCSTLTSSSPVTEIDQCMPTVTASVSTDSSSSTGRSLTFTVTNEQTNLGVFFEPQWAGGSEVAINSSTSLEIPVTNSDSNGTWNASGGTLTVSYYVKNTNLFQMLSSGNTISAAVPALNGPTITVPSDITTSTEPGTSTSVSYSVSATDYSGATLSQPSCTPYSSGSGVPIGTHTITCTSTDSFGQMASKSFKIIVNELVVVCSELTAGSSQTSKNQCMPGVTATASVNTAAIESGRILTVDVTNMKDSIQPVVTIPWSSTFEISNSSMTFEIPISYTGSAGTFGATGGTITLGYDVKNTSNSQTLSSGNTISVSIPAAPDNEAPVVTVPGNLVYGGDSSGRTLDSLSVAGISNIAIPVSDNIGVEYDKAFCDSSMFQHLPSHLVFTSEAGKYGIGTTTVNCYADDAAGNRGTASFTITIIDGDYSIEGVGTAPVSGSDTTAPVVLVPGNLVFGGDGGARYLYGSDVAGITNITIPVSDNVGVEYNKAFCDSSMFQHLPSQLLFTSEAGSYRIGTTTINCYADDAAGNRGTASFTVTIIDGDFSVEGVGTPPGPGSDMEIFLVSPYQDGNNWRYTVTGMGPSAGIEFTTINPAGTNDGVANGSINNDGLIFTPVDGLWTLQICDTNVSPVYCENKTFTLSGTGTASSGSSDSSSLTITSFSQSKVNGDIIFNVGGTANLPLSLINPNSHMAGIGSSSTEHPLSVRITDKATSSGGPPGSGLSGVADFYVFTTGGATSFNIQSKVFAEGIGGGETIAEYNGDFTLKICAANVPSADGWGNGALCAATKDFTVDMQNTQAASTPTTSTPTSTPTTSTPTTNAPTTTQLTINSLVIYEDAFNEQIRYTVIGDSPPGIDSVKITFTKPDGSVWPGGSTVYTDSYTTTMSGYTYDNSLVKSSEMLSGIWTMKVCTGDGLKCVEKTFTSETSYSAPPTTSTPTTSTPTTSTPTTSTPIIEESRTFTHVIYGDELKTMMEFDRDAVIQFTGNPNGLKGFELYDKSKAPNTSNCQSGWNADEYSVCVFETKNMELGYHEWFDRTTDTWGKFYIMEAFEAINTFEDNIAPTFTTNTLEFKTTDPNGMRIDYPLPPVSDNAAMSAIPVCAPTSGSIFPVGTTNVICIITDDAGNTGSDSFTVTVVNTQATGDTFPPTFTTTSNISVKATTANGAKATYNIPIVTDNVGVTLGPVCDPPSGSFFSLGTTVVTCTASDAKFNMASTSFKVTVDSGIVTPEVIPVTVSMNVGKQSYSSTEPVFLTGSVSPVTKDTLTLQVRSSEGNLVAVEDVKLDADSFTHIIMPNPFWDVSGKYTVLALYDNGKANTEFNFGASQQVEQIDSFIPTDIKVSVDKDTYDVGETVMIDTQLVGGSIESTIISIIGPAGQLLLQPQSTDPQGYASLQYTLEEEDAVTGTYTVTASSKGANWDLTESVSFTGIAPIPEITASTLEVTTEEGGSAASYDAGDLGLFKTVLNVVDEAPVLVTINVFDAEGNTLGVGYFKSKLAQGESEIVLGFELPEDLKSGVAEVYTNVFTDWPDRGGVPITNELSANVQIIGLDNTPPELIVPVNQSVITQNDLGGVAEELLEISATDNVGVSLLECTSDLSSVNDAFTLDLSQVVAPLFATGKIDGVLFPEGTTQIDCKAEDAEGNVTEKSFTFEVVRADSLPVVAEVVEEPEGIGLPIDPNVLVPTLTASAYLDSTSSTGRIIAVTTSNLDPDTQKILYTIEKLGVTQILQATIMDNGLSYIEIPEDLEADTYDIVWTIWCKKIYNEVYDSCFFADIHDDIFTVPSLSGTEPEQVVEPDSAIIREIITTSINYGAALPTCADTDACLTPSTITIKVGETITWENDDAAPHRLVSGTTENGPDGIFDSGILVGGADGGGTPLTTSFSHTFSQPGEFTYFDMINPWIQGTVIVEE